MLLPVLSAESALSSHTRTERKEGERRRASESERARAIKSERANRSAHESSRAQHPAHPLRSQPAACVGPACRRAQPPLLPGHPRWEPSVAGIPFFRLLVSPRGPAHAATQNSSPHHRLSSHLCARCRGLACVDACTSAGACASWRLSVLPSLRALDIILLSLAAGEQHAAWNNDKRFIYAWTPPTHPADTLSVFEVNKLTTKSQRFKMEFFRRDCQVTVCCTDEPCRK